MCEKGKVGECEGVGVGFWDGIEGQIHYTCTVHVNVCNN